MPQQPDQPHLQGRHVQARRDGFDLRLVGDLRPAGGGTPERKEGHPGDAVCQTEPEFAFELPTHHAVRVLHGGDPGRLRTLETIEIDGAQPDGADLALIAQGDHHRHLVFEVDDLLALRRQSGTDVGAAQVDQRQVLHSQAGEVGFDAHAELLGTLRQLDGRSPLRIGVGPHFAGHHDAVAGTEHPRDGLIDGAVAVELGGIEMVDPEGERVLQKFDRLGAIGDVPQLHRAVADPGDLMAAERVEPSGQGDRWGVFGDTFSPCRKLASGGCSAFWTAKGRSLRLSSSSRLRTDAAKNRERLIAAAQELFSAGEKVFSLEGVARAAKLGIGTLYRHFPTREVLVEAVYRAELDALALEAEPLLAAHPAAEALRRWMDRYARFVGTKRAMYDALRIAVSSGGRAPETRVRIRATVAKFMAAGASDGTLRGDVDPDDIAVNLAGIVLATNSTDPPQMGRLLDLLMDALQFGRRDARS